MEAAFRVLDAELSIEAPAESVEPIHNAYAKFAVGADDLADPVRIRFEPTDPPAILVDERRIPALPDVGATVQLYQQFLTELLGGIGSHAVLHAAALADRGGGAFLISAPSGHGKSSTTLGLVERGYAFLSDDYAPIDLEQRTVHPYPRAVAMIPGGKAPVPEIFRSAAAQPGVPYLFDKALLHVEQLLGRDAVCREPAPLRHVVLLAGSNAEEAEVSTRLNVTARSHGADEIEHEFASIDGIEIVARQDDAHLRRWQLSLRHDRQPTAALSSILDRPEVIYCEKQWGNRPDFNATPRAVPIKRREAAQFLGRELLNRRGGGRLIERYSGNVPLLFLDLAAALRDATCWRVHTGRYEPLLDLIERLVAGDETA